MEATLFMKLPEWLDSRLREQAKNNAQHRQQYIRSLLIRELGIK
jgi:hypothetical protein